MTTSTNSPQTGTARGSHFSASGIARNVLSNWLGLAVNIVVAFFISPFVVHRLGDTRYGIWALVLQLTGYMGVVDVGLRSALVRFISRFHAQRDNTALNNLVSTTLILYGGFALICFGVGFLLAAFALPFFHIPAGLLRDARITIVLAAVILGTDFLFATFQAALVGVSRWDLRNAVAIGVLILRTVFVIAFLLAGYGLVTLALIQLLTSLAGHVIEVILVHRVLSGLRVSIRTWDKTILRPIISHSTHSFLISIGSSINYEVDNIVIALFLPISQVTLYVIGSRLVQYLRLLINGSTSIVAPLASELDAQGREQETAHMLVRGSKYALLIGYLGAAALCCLGPDFIRIWMGPSYGPVSGTVMRILAVGQFVALTEMMAAHLLYGLGKHRVNTWCTLGEAAVNLGASIALARPFGIYGVAAGTTAAAVIFRGWIFPAAFLKIFRVRWWDYFKSSVVPSIPPTIGFVLGALLMKGLVPINGYGTLVLSAMAGLAVFVPSLWFGALDANERQRIRSGLIERRLLRFPMPPASDAKIPE